MIKKIRQILTDHKAMSYMRKYCGDMKMVAYVSPYGQGYDCYPYQFDEYVSDSDPARAIIKATEMYNQQIQRTSR